MLDQIFKHIQPFSKYCIFLVLCYSFCSCGNKSSISFTINKVGDPSFSKGYLFEDETFNKDMYLIDINEYHEGLIIELDNSQTDFINFYEINAGDTVLSQNSGDKVKFYNRKIPHRNTIYKPTSSKIIIEVINRGAYLVPINILSIEDYLFFDSQRSLWIGFGLSSILLFLILSIGFILKAGMNKTIFYYWFFTLMAFIYFFMELGYGDMYFWPQHPEMEEPAIFIIILGSMLALLLLVFQVFRLHKSINLLKYGQRVLGAIGTVMIACILFGLLKFDPLFSLLYDGMIWYVVMCFLYVIVAGVWAMKDGVPNAGLFLLSFSFMIVGTILKPFSLAGLIPASFMVQYGGLIGQVINIVLLAVLFILYYFQRANSMRKLEQEIVNLERSALQSQMNPHFIFNSLNSIQNFIAKNDSVSAMDYLSKFAILIRKTLNAAGQKFISLEEEMVMLEGYLTMEKLRFKDKFDYHISTDVSINANDWMLPPMLIQPFVENAIIHGLGDVKYGGHVEINFKYRGEYMEVEIIDNGKGFAPDKTPKAHQSKAMIITKSRLEILNKKAENISVTNRSLEGMTGTKVALEIKLIEKSNKE